MKKTNVIAILIICIITLSACSFDETIPSIKECAHSNITHDRAITPTCTESGLTAGSHCADCGKVLTEQKTIEPYGHTTTTGTCSRCGKNFSAWEIGNYVDEFDRPMNKKYMCCDFTGVFSNSATTNSKLEGTIQIDSDNASFILQEYGSHLVKGVFDYESYLIRVLDENNTAYTLYGTIYKGNYRIYVDDEYLNNFLLLLEQNNTLKFFMQTSKYSVSTYSFKVDINGFSDAYSNISNSNL